MAPNIAEVSDTTVISCPTTTAAGPAVDGRPRQGSRSGYTPTYQANDIPPPTEQPCRTLYAKQPAVIAYGRWGPELDWVRPDGVVDSHVNGDMPSAPTPSDSLVPLDYAVSVAGQNHLYVWYKNETATYGGAHGWQCQGGSWTFRDTCTYGGAAPVACAQTRVTGPLVSATGGPPDPAPMIKDQAASLREQVHAGTMGTSPNDPARHFAFLPSCFWLNGTQQGQTFELQVQDPTLDPATGSPDGRAITYVYRISVGLKNVHWDFGDGSSKDGSAGTPWNPASPNSCSNDHTYERISASGRPGATACPAGYPHTATDDQCYRVQATETYAVSVTAYWFDGAGPHAPVDMGSMAPLVIAPPPTYVRVQQIEGVPVTRPPA
ncbi:MAG: hypothetical protein NVSMB17_06170 [Candidatus Dormibacteria bacterium]